MFDVGRIALPCAPPRSVFHATGEMNEEDGGGGMSEEVMNEKL